MGCRRWGLPSPIDGVSVRDPKLLNAIRELVGGRAKLEKVFGDTSTYENGGFRWSKRNESALSDTEWQAVDSLIHKITGEKHPPSHRANTREIPKILPMGLLMEKFWGIPVNWASCVEASNKLKIILHQSLVAQGKRPSGSSIKVSGSISTWNGCTVTL